MAQKFIAIALVIIIGLWLGNFFEKKSEKTPAPTVSRSALPKSVTPTPAIETNKMNSAENHIQTEENKSTDSASKPTQVQAADLSRIESFFQSGKAPVSFADLKRRITPLNPPRVSTKPAEIDTVIAGVYTGFIFESKTQLQRIRISTGVVNRSALEGGISISSGTDMVDYELNGGNQKNFGGDSYGFVYEIPDGRIIYAKIFTDVYFEKYSMKLRVMSGWIVDPATKRVFKLALMDDMSIVDQKPWPDQDLIEPLLPQKTLRP